MIYELIRRNRGMPRDVIDWLISMQEMREGDNFFAETGIDDEDIEPNITRLGMQQDPELIAIKKDFA